MSYKIRDPVHTFIQFDDDEKAVVDSAPFQRLRHIHQLAMSYLVYPGASHKRFEHSLGVMELAGRIYDVVTSQENLTDEVRDIVPKPGSSRLAYWRSVVRMAALCHDMGHIPFSHAAEGELLPTGWDHEKISWDIIHSDALAKVWGMMEPPPSPIHIGKLALGPKKISKHGLSLRFTTWEAILAEIVVGDAFGADRMDYLLRDSLHTGVAYGKFDHHRLIDTLRIIPQPPPEPGAEVAAPALGCERGGLESAEALVLARYFMYAQVYFHPTRLIYDIHLRDFVRDWLQGPFQTGVGEHLRMCDNDVLVAIADAARRPDSRGHDPARRIMTRDHFRVADSRRLEDPRGAIEAIATATSGHFGQERVRYGASPPPPNSPSFPVRNRHGESVPCLSESQVLGKIPGPKDEYVFVDREIREEAKAWINTERARIISEASLVPVE